MRDRLPEQYQNAARRHADGGHRRPARRPDAALGRGKLGRAGQPIRSRCGCISRTSGAARWPRARRPSRGRRRGRPKPRSRRPTTSGRGLRAVDRIQRRAHPRRDRGRGEGRSRPQIEAGADFAELATANSTDPGSAAAGRRARLVRRGPDGARVRDRRRRARAGRGLAAGPDPVRLARRSSSIETRDTSPPTLAERAAGDRGRSCARRSSRRSSRRCAPRPTIERPEAATPPAAIRQSDLVEN